MRDERYLLPLITIYDDSLCAKYIYIHPESQNLLREDNSHATSIFYFYFLDQPENLKHQDEYSNHEKMVWTHKRWILFNFLSLFFLILDTYQLNMYDKYILIVFSCRIYIKPFLFVFLSPIHFYFQGSYNYIFHHRDIIFFLVFFHDHDSSFCVAFSLNRLKDIN